MKTPLAAAALAACASLAWAVPAAGASGRDLRYSAPEACPSRDEVARRVEAAQPEGRAARLDIRSAGHGFRGGLVLGEGEGRVERSVAAKTCGAVVDALVLVIALDRPAEAEAPAEVEATSEDAPTAPEDEAAHPATAAPPPAAERTAPSPAAAPRADLSAGLGASATTFAPWVTMKGVSAFVDVARARPALGPLRPSARLTLARTLPLGKDQVRLELTTATLDACPVGLDLWRVTASACARGELGAITFSDGDASKTRPWTTLGLAVRARATLGAIGGARPFVEIGGAAAVPTIRDTFLRPRVPGSGDGGVSYDGTSAASILLSAALAVGVAFR
jgi:hypothetical protein